MDRYFIGSSDIAVILGLNRYKTPLQLWAELTGQIERPDLSGMEAVEWGKRLEKSKVIADKFAELHNCKLIAYKKRYVHSEYDYLSCELDTIIAGTDELVEQKTCSAWQAKNWKGQDEIPAEYICQVMWQLGISGRKKGWIAVLIGGQNYIEREIVFDEQMFKTMVKKAVEFWEGYIVTKVMPSIVSCNDTDTLYELFPQETAGQEIQLGDDMDALIEGLQGLKADAKALAMSIEKQENEIKVKLQEAEFGITPHYRISWKASSRQQIDTKKLREAVPEIAKKYEREVVSRVLRIKEIKEAENGKD